MNADRIPIEIGSRMGILTVEGVTKTGRLGPVAWRCRCDCGRIVEISNKSLRRGRTRCGRCIGARIAPEHRSIYNTWTGMKQRCQYDKAQNYAYYGGRGITVCDRWLVFANFLADMGVRPAGMSLDRIDNNRGYEPGNCRWATRSQQMRNRRPLSTNPALASARRVDRRVILTLLDLGYDAKAVAKMTGRHWSYVYAVWRSPSDGPSSRWSGTPAPRSQP